MTISSLISGNLNGDQTMLVSAGFTSRCPISDLLNFHNWISIYYIYIVLRFSPRRGYSLAPRLEGYQNCKLSAACSALKRGQYQASATVSGAAGEIFMAPYAIFFS